TASSGHWSPGAIKSSAKFTLKLPQPAALYVDRASESVRFGGHEAVEVSQCGERPVSVDPPRSVVRAGRYGIGGTPPSRCIAAKDRFPHAEPTSGVGRHLFDSPSRLLSRTGGKSAIIPGAPRSAALAPSNRSCQQYPAGRSPFPVHRIASRAGQNP